MKLPEIVNVLEATVLTEKDDCLDKEVFKCGASDLMSDILIAKSEGCIFLTGLTTIQVIRTAVIAGMTAVVFVRGKKPSPEMIEMGKEEGIPILSTPYSMFTACGRLHSCGLTGLNGSR